jgi:hypothetical protein
LTSSLSKSQILSVPVALEIITDIFLSVVRLPFPSWEGGKAFLKWLAQLSTLERGEKKNRKHKIATWRVVCL